MKFEETEKDVIQVGDIKNNNVSIDNANTDFIITILSSNLYSNPIESFIRETCSNAWDSHVEAGVEEPIILELGEDLEGNNFCRIQDFGTGISPERFEKIYKNIGSSTKRTDNQQLGGFGIGRFAALAYSDIVHITSNYNGVQYKYLMYKDGYSICIDLLHEQITKERNGVEIKVEIKERKNYYSDGDLFEFQLAIKNQLTYFENIYVISTDETFQEDFNGLKIKKYNNFLINTTQNHKKLDILLGKVRYSLKQSQFIDKYGNLLNHPVSLKFDIGELEITPNREEILYNQKNINKINEKLEKYKKEIQEIIDLKINNKNYEDIYEYYESINRNFFYFIKDSNLCYNKYITITNEDKNNITFKGILYNHKEFNEVYKHLSNIHILWDCKYINSKAITSVKSLVGLGSILENSIVCYTDSLNKISKSYLKDRYVNKYLINPNNINIANFKKQIKNIIKLQNYKSNKNIYKAIYNSFKEKFTKIHEFKLEEIPNNYTINTNYSNNKNITSKTKRAKEEISCHEMYWNREGAISTRISTLDINPSRKKEYCFIIFGEKDDKKLKDLFIILGIHKFRDKNKKYYSKIKVVEIAPTKIKLIKERHNLVNIKNFLNVKYKLIQQIGTTELIDRKIPYLVDLKNILNIGRISKNLENIIEELWEYYNNFYHSTHINNLKEEIYELCLENNSFDKKIQNLLETHSELLKNSKILTLFTKGAYDNKIREELINLCVDYLTIKNLIKVDNKALLKLKKETIFNIKNNENN